MNHKAFSDISIVNVAKRCSSEIVRLALRWMLVPLEGLEPPT